MSNLFFSDLKRYGVGVNLLSKRIATKKIPKKEVYLDSDTPEFWASKILKDSSDITNFIGYWWACHEYSKHEERTKYNYLFDINFGDKYQWIKFFFSLILPPKCFTTEEEIKKIYNEINNQLDYALLNHRVFKEKDVIFVSSLISAKSDFALMGINTKKLNEKISILTSRIIEPKFTWLNISSIKTKSKVKVGFFVNIFTRYTGHQFFLDFLSINPDIFDVRVYSFNDNKNRPADLTKLKTTMDYTNNIFCTKDHEQIIKKINNDQLDYLIFLDPSPINDVIGEMRLAKIQCQSYDPPTTTGKSTIDYFFSGELIEIEDAQSHYTEKLVKLPNCGFYAKKSICETKKDRKDLMLPEEKILYLCCQMQDKYLPQYDYFFPYIARQVPDAIFIFIKRNQAQHSWDFFMERIRNSFDKENVNFDNHILQKNHLDSDSYLNLINLSDIFLDTIGWSGGITSFDAFSYGLPIVTMATEFMRGRQSYGMYQQMGITDLIAKNEKEYIELAVKLGKNQNFREEMKQKILSKNNVLFEDKEVIKALEKFLIETIKNYD